MKQYQDLVRDVLENGHDSGDRTGTGTKSVFGRQVRFDLKEGFPLVTTKRTFWKGVVVELLWLMRGETNIKFLTDRGVHIWDEWADENGNLGPVYGRQWRKWENAIVNDIKRFDMPDQSDITGTMQSIGNLGDNEKYIEHHMYKKMYQTWYGMLKRCYNKDHQAYENYGGKGVFVDNRWLIFSNFFEDVQKLTNWNLKQAFPDEYTLDKDFYESNKYGPDTCRWSNIVEQSTNISGNENFFIAEDPNGNKTVEYGLRPFTEKYNLSKICISNVLRGINQTHKGWKFYKLYAPEGKIPRYIVVDQIKKAISEIKYNPNSRRILVSAYNAGELERMALEPCHTMFQFYVRDGKLSCQLYQRSADLFLGVPFNIASYALLTHLVANDAGLQVGEFVHTFGDLHLYNNHLDQCKELMSREPLDLPKLHLNLIQDDLMYFIDHQCNKMDWKQLQEVIKLLNYKSHPALKGEVSV